MSDRFGTLCIKALIFWKSCVTAVDFLILQLQNLSILSKAEKRRALTVATSHMFYELLDSR